MALKDFMAISGQSGLFKYVSQGRNGIIVESLVDGKRTHVSASAKVSALSDISIFTNDGEKPLGEVLEKIKEKENGEQTISHKSSNEELKSLFLEVIPDYDTDRVYVSDIKKVVSWYNQLQSLGILEFVEKEEEPEKKDEGGSKKTESSKEAAGPKSKAKPKKTTQAKKKPTESKKGSAPKPKGSAEGGTKKVMPQKKS